MQQYNDLQTHLRLCLSLSLSLSHSGILSSFLSHHLPANEIQGLIGEDVVPTLDHLKDLHL